MASRQSSFTQPHISNAKHVGAHSEQTTNSKPTRQTPTSESGEHFRNDPTDSCTSSDNNNTTSNLGTSSIVFNYSSIELTEDMDKVINKGLNFSILPKKLDMTQVWVDIKRFERSCIWQEFWYGRDDQQMKTKPIFKLQKTNLPKNYSIPEGLKTFLSSVRSEIQDYQNRNSANCNLPVNEMDALLKLQKLQKERQIVIRACDKGAGVIVLDFNEYLKACYEHLTSEIAPGQPYYSPVNELEIETTKEKIRSLLKQGLDNDIISKSEFEEMSPDDKGPGSFYCKGNHIIADLRYGK